MDLASIQTELKTSIVHRGPFSLIWPPADQVYRPTLQAAAAQWFGEKCMKVAEPSAGAFAKLAKDLQPQRVGVVRTHIDSTWDPPLKPLHLACLHCLPVSWADFEHMRYPALRAQVAPPEHFSVLSVTCLVMSSDGMLIMSQRSKKVATEHGAWSVTCAGYADLSRVQGSTGAVSAVYAELEEEAGLTAGMLEGEPEGLGLCQHPSGEGQNPAWIEGVYLAHAKIKAAEILDLARGAESRWEGQHFPRTWREVQAMMAAGEKFHTPAAANLVLAFEASKR